MKSLRKKIIRQTEEKPTLAPLTIDLIVTILCCVLWLFFSYQYGFTNSPDSWYRGVLGKSIAEGHPLFINLKQGWIYEFDPIHHDASHEPFLPLLYAFFFLIFGNKILIANIISTLSAGLLIFPLLRLSRSLLNTPWPAFFIYLLTVCQGGYLFEVTAGLAIPTSLLATVFFLFFLCRMLESNSQKWIWGAALALASFYLLRSEAQLIFFWTMLWTLILGYKILDKEKWINLSKMWGISFLFAAPCLFRKLILFGSPFFTHMTPRFWTDRSYDYWSYHEAEPYPSIHTYFTNHTRYDLFEKIFIKGLGNHYRSFDRAVTGPLWLYLGIFILSAIFITLYIPQKKEGFVFMSLWIIFVGYCGIFTLVPISGSRYFVPSYFTIFFTVVSALFLIYQRYVKKRTHRFTRDLLFYACLIGLVCIIQADFWGNFSKKYIKFSFKTSDQKLQQDPLIKALSNRFDAQDVILGPFAKVQYLSFATDLTFIEKPDNLRQLANPIAFFQRYHIRYSLVNIKGIIPDEFIENIEPFGNTVLFTISQSSNRLEEMRKIQAEQLKELVDDELQESIKQGIEHRKVYIDNFHGNPPPNLDIFESLGLTNYVSQSNFVAEKERLFQSGLLLMVYAIGKHEISEEEELIVDQYIANGGRIFLLCPGWVWVAYDKKALEYLPHNKVAKRFNIIIAADYVTGPFEIIKPQFRIGNVGNKLTGVFSEIISWDSAETLLVGKDGKIASVAAKNGDSRIIIWGQNNLLKDEISSLPEGQTFLTYIFTWLFADD